MRCCLVCAALTAATADENIRGMRLAREQGADVVELRLDMLRAGESWERVVDARPLPMIVTNRAAWEGGGYCRAPERERLAVLQRAAARGVEYIDVELAAVRAYRRLCEEQESDGGGGGGSGCGGAGTRLILSKHEFARPLSARELSASHNAMVAAGADVRKLVMMCDDIVQNAAVFDLLQRAVGVPGGGTPTVALAMSEHGQLSRLLAGKFGPAHLTFTSLDAGLESAPGQLSTRDCVSLYRFKEVSCDTDVYGIVGDPVSHSMSPAIHNRAFGMLGLDKVYVPLLVRRPSSDDNDNDDNGDNDRLGAFFKCMPRYGLRGCSITIPHKERAMRHVDEVDPVARRIGAINTVVVDAVTGRTTGYNTDWMAAMGAIEEALGSPSRSEAAAEPGAEQPLRGKHVVLLGAGGAARALAFGAVSRRCARLTIVNRTRERAESLVREVMQRQQQRQQQSEGDGADSVAEVTAATACSLDEFLHQARHDGRLRRDDHHNDDDHRDDDDDDDDRCSVVLLNSTSIGMHPRVDDTPVPADVLHARMLVFDAVYNPIETRLLREARRAGCRTVSGLEMFVRQAVKQFELWTGCRAPVDAMRQVVLERLQPQQAQRH